MLGGNAVGGGLLEFGVDNACSLPAPGTPSRAAASLGKEPRLSPFLSFPEAYTSQLHLPPSVLATRGFPSFLRRQERL